LSESSWLVCEFIMLGFYGTIKHRIIKHTAVKTQYIVKYIGNRLLNHKFK